MFVCFKSEISTNQQKTTTMNNIAEFLENNFFPRYKITKISKDDESRHMLICLEPMEAPSCPHCHSHNVVVHDYRKKELKDEKILGYFVTLEVIYRTVISILLYALHISPASVASLPSIPCLVFFLCACPQRENSSHSMCALCGNITFVN